VSHLLYCASLSLGLVLFLEALFWGGPGLHFLMLLSVVALLAAGKGCLRLVAVSELLPTWREKLLAYGWAWTLLASVVPGRYGWTSVGAALPRQTAGRGILYDRGSPTDSRILTS